MRSSFRRERKRTTNCDGDKVEADDGFTDEEEYDASDLEEFEFEDEEDLYDDDFGSRASDENEDEDISDEQ